VVACRINVYYIYVDAFRDGKRAVSKLAKHGVSFDEAVTVFADLLAVVVEDELYPERTILIGHSEKRRILFTVFVELSDELVRIISARRASSHERRRYEEGNW
jgi:uncharacterized DUF497 family protein